MVRKVLVIVLLLTAMVFQGVVAVTPGDPLPQGAQQTKVWKYENGSYVETPLAQSWNSLPQSLDSTSNVSVYRLSIVNHVSIAQWVEWSLTGTRKDWRIRRPGTYASDSMTVTIRSNNALAIEFWAEDPEYVIEVAGVTRTIPKWFSVGGDAPDMALSWLRATDTSAQSPYTYVLPDGMALHNGISFVIWELIEVVPSNSASDYEGRGYLTIRLTNVKHWVDPQTGLFHLGWPDPVGTLLPLP